MIRIITLLAIFGSVLAQNSHMFSDLRHRHRISERKQFSFSDYPAQLRNSRAEHSTEDFRLPKAWTPISYFIRIKPNINTDESLEGYVEILFVADDATNNITLHVDDTFGYDDSITLHPEDDSSDLYLFTDQGYDPVTEFYVGTFDRPLQVGVRYIVTMNYTSSISKNLIGLYKSSYINEAGQIVNLASTQMQPNSARNAFPCFDDPAWKATFQIEMGRQNFYGAIANMPLLSTRKMEDEVNWSWDLFDVSPKMSSYLVAFVVSDFVSTSKTSENGVEFRVWAREELIDQAAYSLDIGPEILTYFEEYYAIPYPLPKSDMIALPDFDAGAMENWGLITYRENELLYSPYFSSASNKQNAAQVVAHELAHMWFGDLVTLMWWNDLWLNEGFATYVEYLGANYVEPMMNMNEQFVTAELQPVFHYDSLLTSHPLRQDVTTTAEIYGLFDKITYSKGGSVIRMMNHFLTEDSFRAGVTRYLNENAYGNTVQNDLFRSLDLQAKEDGTLAEDLNVESIMNTWTLQEGFPVVHVFINGDGTALLRQERYLKASTGTSSPLTYWIPITHTSGGATLPNFTNTFPSDWMSASEREITISGLDTTNDWYLFNIQQVGYYRVNYEDANWRAIRDQLTAVHDVIDIRNRAQVIDDSFNLARSGHLIYDIPFEISAYLASEEHHVPWQAAFSNFAYIEEMFTRTSSYGSLKNYLQSLIIPVYTDVGFEDSISDDHTVQLLRSNVVSWACDLGYDSCLDSATKLFALWMTTPDDFRIVSPNLKSGVYCTAIAEGGDAEWDFAWGRYRVAVTATEVDYLLFGMSCSTDIPTLEWYLDFAFQRNRQIRMQDVHKIFNGVAGNDIGRDIAWDYLTSSHKYLANFYEGSYEQIQDMAATVSMEFNTKKELNELKCFRDILIEEGVANTAIIDRAIEQVENNISWMSSNYGYITAWLEENGFGTK